MVRSFVPTTELKLHEIYVMLYSYQMIGTEAVNCRNTRSIWIRYMNTGKNNAIFRFYQGGHLILKGGKDMKSQKIIIFLLFLCLVLPMVSAFKYDKAEAAEADPFGIRMDSEFDENEENANNPYGTEGWFPLSTIS